MLLIGMPGGPELILIFVVVLLLFGGKKIPELMRGIGKGVKEFKKGVSEIEDIKDDIKEDIDKATEEESKKIK
jgi:sec-independent protein translocase protein TatA